MTVAVVADTTENEKQYSKVHDLIAAGIPFRFDNTLAMLHSKYLILNGTAVETGSLNYTACGGVQQARRECLRISQCPADGDPLYTRLEKPLERGNAGAVIGATCKRPTASRVCGELWAFSFSFGATLNGKAGRPGVTPITVRWMRG